MLCVLTKTHKQSNQPTNNQASFLPFSTNWCGNWRNKDRKLRRELQICFPLLTFLIFFPHMPTASWQKYFSYMPFMIQEPVSTFDKLPLFSKSARYIYFPLIRCFAFFVRKQPMGIPIWECWGLLVGEFKLNFYRDKCG